MDALLGSHFSHTVAALSGAPSTYAMAPLGMSVSPEDGGKYRVAGVVAEVGSPNTPVRRAVRLFHPRSGRLVREVASDPVTGSYAFEYVAIGPWVIVAHDYEHDFNAVIADNILGDPM